MQISDRTSEDAVLAELGARIRQTRLARNMPQAELAERAGTTEATIRKLESGEPGQLRIFLRVLRALDLQANVDQLIPQAAASPIAESDSSARVQQRARRRRPPATPWTWGDSE
ncbi:MAG: helix-turn-helix transcriptional regulator [Solirubrobacterales bacterium]